MTPQQRAEYRRLATEVRTSALAQAQHAQRIEQKHRSGQPPRQQARQASSFAVEYAKLRAARDARAVARVRQSIQKMLARLQAGH